MSRAEKMMLILVGTVFAAGLVFQVVDLQIGLRGPSTVEMSSISTGQRVQFAGHKVELIAVMTPGDNGYQSLCEGSYQHITVYGGLRRPAIAAEVDDRRVCVELGGSAEFGGVVIRPRAGDVEGDTLPTLKLESADGITDRLRSDLGGVVWGVSLGIISSWIVVRATIRDEHLDPQQATLASATTGTQSSRPADDS